MEDLAQLVALYFAAHAVISTNVRSRRPIRDDDTVFSLAEVTSKASCNRNVIIMPDD